MIQRLLGVLLLFLFLSQTVVYAADSNIPTYNINTSISSNFNIDEDLFSSKNTEKIEALSKSTTKDTILSEFTTESKKIKEIRDKIVTNSTIKEVVIDGKTYIRSEAISKLDSYSTTLDDANYTITNLTPQILENAKANNDIKARAEKNLGNFALLKDDILNLKKDFSNDTAYTNKTKELAAQKFPYKSTSGITDPTILDSINKYNTAQDTNRNYFTKLSNELKVSSNRDSIVNTGVEYNNAKQSLKNLENNITTNRQFKENYTKETNRTWSLGMLPGFEGNIYDFFNKIIRASVSISMTLAVLMLVLAGFAAVQAKDSAKEDYFTKVRNISTGIALILLSYMIIAGVYALFYSL